jgi:hypothetical protein
MEHFMQELMVLSGNPSRRRRKSGKRRSAKQRAATRKLVSFMKAKRGGSSRRRSRSFSANPSAPRTKRRYRRRMSKRIGRAFSRARGSNMMKPFSIVAPALTGAVGAVAVNAILSRVPLPPMLITGKVRFLTQGAAAIGLGMLASNFKFLGAQTAAKMAEGSLTVTLADMIRELAGDAGIQLSGMGYYLPGVRARALPNNGGGSRPGAQMGKYMTGPGANVSTLVQRRAGFGNIARTF